ncbi:hypothetical protein [Nocardia blacklockiae]|uniref:hypothetical protein n=1 Tax=Nocardia blacklockiae TaxID=480036 RepID=UPI00189639A7|nr:hypothetical protein [Nocardia blacklockiae]MBF6174268.1 hypothetical protein [Nocardia blacklockiae]
MGWQDLLRQAPDNIDQAWVAITSEPRRRDGRQHQLRGELSTHKVSDRDLDHWQYEVTAGGRIWYAIDDEARTLWITRAGTGHPKETDRRRR